MSKEKIYVCPRWETVGVETLVKPLHLTDGTGAKSVSGLLMRDGRRVRFVFPEGGYFTTLPEAHNHANALKVAEEAEVKRRDVKLKLQGYFSGDMMALPVVSDEEIKHELTA